MKLDRQSVLDAACLFIGSAVGAAASAAFLLHQWTKKGYTGQPPAGVPTGEREPQVSHTQAPHGACSE